MNGIDKKLLIPIAAFIALMIKQFTGIEVGQEELDIAVDGILSILTLVGILMNRTKQ